MVTISIRAGHTTAQHHSHRYTLAEVHAGSTVVFLSVDPTRIDPCAIIAIGIIGLIRAIYVLYNKHILPDRKLTLVSFRQIISSNY